MSEVDRLGATIAGWFVRPGDVRAEERVARPPMTLDEPVVLAAGDATALGLGAALALALAPGGVAVVACWQIPAAARRRGGLASGRARRLVASLQSRGVEASAVGRLVVVALPVDAREAVVLLRRVESACGDAVCVPVLAGARGAEWDEVLTERGVAVLHGADRAVLDLATARLAEQGVQARVLDVVPGVVARALAVGGWTPPGARSLRATAAGARTG